MTAKWMVYAKKADFDGLAREFSISPVTARIIRNRDVCGSEAVRKYLYGSWEDLYSPHMLKDADRAADLLLEAVRAGKRIRIVGDYDIDGVCSVYILYKALTRLGACVDYEIPDRIRDGYGINETIVEAAARNGIEVILTCDNGIAALSQLAKAREAGMTVIVTDHHEVIRENGQDVLPPADAVVNPKRSDCGYPWKEICGAVAAYKLVQILYERREIPQKEWRDMVEFAAIATVGDVMRLQDENRILVKKGLAHLPDTASMGLRCLIEKNNLDISHISAYHIGFVIGPAQRRRTAADGETGAAAAAFGRTGRGGPAGPGTEGFERPAEGYDGQRRGRGGAAGGRTVPGRQGADHFPAGLPRISGGHHRGRLRERYHKPSFVLTRAEDGVKGSGRSIESYHMYQALTEVKELLTKFGGHPMAAGLSLPESQVDAFRRALNEKAKLTEEDFVPKIWIDAAMPLNTSPNP